MILLKIISTYKCKDGRIRAYCRDEYNNPKVISYPRILMEESLGRPLEPYEDVHHVDEDTDNNNINNLQIINHGVHQKLHSSKYFDKPTVCEICHKTFIWTSERQRLYYADLRRGKNRIISCSRKCSSYYGRQEQLGRDPLAECGLNGETSPNGNTVPNNK